MTTRPKIKLKKTASDWYIDSLNLALLLANILLPVFTYTQLPESIPIHYDFSGTVDNYGDKMTIWLLPGVALLIWAGMYWLARVPHIHNYTVEVTPTNAEKLYRTSSRLVRLVTGSSLLAFLVITIAISYDKASLLGGWFLPGILAITFIPIIWGIWKAKKIARQN